MKLTFAALTLVTLTAMPVAYAADAKLTDCVSMSKQVADALESAQPGDAADQAREQAKAGRSYCSSQMYALGVARYTKALQLLGKG